MGFYVTRQSNYYDDGAYSVEIACALDYAGPGALVSKYPGEFEEFEDPREAVEAAIRIGRQWRQDADLVSVPYELFTIAGNALVYATVADAYTSKELREWGERAYERLLKCCSCGGLAVPGHALYPWYAPGEEEYACCSERCVEQELTESQCE